MPISNPRWLQSGAHLRVNTSQLTMFYCCLSPVHYFTKKLLIFLSNESYSGVSLEREDSGFSACYSSRHPDFSLWEISAAYSLWLAERRCGSLAYSTGPKWWVIALNKFFANWYLLSHKSQCQPFRFFDTFYECRRRQLMLYSCEYRFKHVLIQTFPNRSHRRINRGRRKLSGGSNPGTFRTEWPK